jgi:hypothetical protein
MTCPQFSFTPEYDNFQLFHLRFEPGWGSARGKGRRLSPLPLAQLCRSLLLVPPQTLSGFDIPSCCVDALRCTRSGRVAKAIGGISFLDRKFGSYLLFPCLSVLQLRLL